jgi:hypothetical protein
MRVEKPDRIVSIVRAVDTDEEVETEELELSSEESKEGQVKPADQVETPAEAPAEAPVESSDSDSEE